MSPDVDGLVGELEAAQQAVLGGALGVPVARDDAVLPEHLWSRGRAIHFLYPFNMRYDRRHAHMMSGLKRQCVFLHSTSTVCLNTVQMRY